MAFTIESTTECFGDTAGLAIAANFVYEAKLNDVAGTERSHSAAILAMYGLLLQGRTRFEEIALFRNDRFFQEAFGLPFVPAPSTLRLYLEKLARRRETMPSLQEVNQRLLAGTRFTTTSVEGREYLPVDIDVSVMDNSDSKKEGVGRTYAGIDGYAPIFAYIGTEGYMLDCELRPGKQHCQNGTPGFISRCVASVEALHVQHPILYRLDSGNDACATIKAILGGTAKNFFVIKRCLRREKKEDWLEKAQVLGTKREERPGKIIYTGTLTKEHPVSEPGMPELDIVFRVVERTIDREGKALLIPDIEVDTWWTNLYESPESIIALYDAHGTSEQFHSELKSDMNVERLPSGSMSVNALILALAEIAFNTLRKIGQCSLALPEALPHTTNVKRKRLRKVIDDIIRMAFKLVRHGRSLHLKVSQWNPWTPLFQALYYESLRN